MICPYCQQEMEQGYLNSRSPVLWSREVSGLPFSTSREDVMLGGKLGLVMRPQAFLCRTCRTVITKY